MFVYKFNDYRDAIRDAVDQRKGIDGKYLYGHFAEAIRVQAAYLSRVFRKVAHLNSDQLDMACRELGLTQIEYEFMFLLFEYIRSGNSERRTRLMKRIEAIREENTNTSKHLTAEVVDSANERAKYELYLEPLAPVVHGFLHLPDYQKEPLRIARVLGCSSKKLKEIMANLESLGLIEAKGRGNEYQAQSSFVHLDKYSSLNSAYQLLTRSLYSEQLRRTAPEDKHQYTVTITTDSATAEAVYAEFNAYLQKVEKLVKGSKARGVYQLSFDFFRWDLAGKPGELGEAKKQPSAPAPRPDREKGRNYAS